MAKGLTLARSLGRVLENGIFTLWELKLPKFDSTLVMEWESRVEEERLGLAMPG